MKYKTIVKSKAKNFKNWLKSLLGYQPLDFITWKIFSNKIEGRS